VIQFHAFLASALERSEWSASQPGHFTLWEMSPQYPLNRRLGGPMSQSGHGGEEKPFLLLLRIKSYSSIP